MTEDRIRKYWETRSPGLADSDEEVGTSEFFNEVERERFSNPFTYQYLKDVAEFDRHPGEKVLEIGVGLGTDILQYARNGSDSYGIDLTARAIELTANRFELEGLNGTFRQASFTEIPFDDDTFDLVYSFGVLHHSPGTEEGIAEIRRVLKPGGRTIVMIYHKGFKYYIRKLLLYGVLRGEFRHSNSQQVVNRHSEAFGDSPLTKVYSRTEARRMFSGFQDLTLDCFRLDDSFVIAGRRVSPTESVLPRTIFRAIENRAGWNLIVKGRKPLI